MSLTVFYMDDFSDYGAAPAANAVCKPLMLEGLFSQIDSPYSIAVDPGGSGVPCLYLNSVGASYACTVAPTEGSSTSFNIAARFYLSLLASYIPLISVCPSTLGNISTNTPLLAVDAGGYLHIRGGGTTFASSLVPAINALGTYHIELYFALTGTSAGNPVYSWRVWVEGVEVTFDAASATFVYTNGPDTSNLAVIGVLTGSSPSTAINAYCKDLIIGVSSDGGTTKIGTKFVTTTEPAADVALGGWVPSTGSTGFPILATNPPGADYVSASSAGVPETYQCSMTSLPANVSSVLAVMSVVRGQKTDGGDATMTISAVSGASHTDGAARPFTAQANNYYDVFSVDPATSGAWSKAAVDAMNLKMARTV